MSTLLVVVIAAAVKFKNQSQLQMSMIYRYLSDAESKTVDHTGYPISFHNTQSPLILGNTNAIEKLGSVQTQWLWVSNN